MSSKKTVILLGWVMEGQLPLDGESAKNQQIVNRLRSLGWRVIVLDFYKWKRRPWVIAKTLACFGLYPSTPVILSSSATNIYRFMRMHHLLGARRKVLHWVIGGTFGDKTRRGVFDPKVLRSLTCHFVESQRMADDLHLCGVDNVRVVPNFKMIDYIPQKQSHSGAMRFVFISRIMAEKGVDLIFQAALMLDSEGYASRYTIDFYGNIDNAYRQSFETQLAATPAASYGGFLDFSTHAAYDRLASYDVMLFPTYWKGEGFAGIFIDSFVAQTPLIATDWCHNRSILEPTGSAVIIPPHSAEALAQAMRDCIDGTTDIAQLTERCRQAAPRYDSRSVIDDELLRVLSDDSN